MPGFSSTWRHGTVFRGKSYLLNMYFLAYSPQYFPIWGRYPKILLNILKYLIFFYQARRLSPSLRHRHFIIFRRLCKYIERKKKQNNKGICVSSEPKDAHQRPSSWTSYLYSWFCMLFGVDYNFWWISRRTCIGTSFFILGDYLQALQVLHSSCYEINFHQQVAAFAPQSRVKL